MATLKERRLCRQCKAPTINKFFCCVECKWDWAREQSGSIAEPKSPTAVFLADQLIAARKKEIDAKHERYVARRSPEDDTPRAEIRMRRFLMLRRKRLGGA